MESIASTVRRVLQNPGPIICLDTCDLLNRLQWLKELDVEAPSYYLPHQMRESLVRPGATQVYLVATFLVEIEFGQRIGKIRQELEVFLRSTQNHIQKIRKVWEEMPTLPFFPGVDVTGSSLVSQLEQDLKILLAEATILEEDQAASRRALERVFQKTPPTEEGEIKDAVHLEHYLELAKLLKLANYPHGCYFASSDKRAFWERAESGPKNSKFKPNLRPELTGEFAQAGLEFLAGLDVAFKKMEGGRL